MENWRKFIKFVTWCVTAVLTVMPFATSITPNTSMTITANYFEERQTLEGWGTSACWWSQMVSDEETREDLAKKFFSKEGLGLNIYRYNIGGGVNPDHHRVSTPWRSTESFYYYNEASGKYEYDFSRDANAQAFLFKALEYDCIDTVVLFANSPHYSMTISGEASGNYVKGETNLAPERYQDFVDYFLTITEYFIDKGVPVKYISPINEPQWDWSGDWVGQEGCHYEKEQVIEIMRLFSRGIDERGLDVKLSAPESGQIQAETREYFSELAADEEIAKNIGSYSYHSYWNDGVTSVNEGWWWNNLQSKIDFGKWLKENGFSNKNVEMSEWCELPCQNSVDEVEGAVKMARVMLNDVYYTGVNSWTSWVAVNTIGIGEDGKKYSDGLFYATDDFSEYNEAARYYAMAHITKFVPAGSVVLETSADKASYVYNVIGEGDNIGNLHTNFCSFKTPEGKTVIVITNEDAEKTIRINAVPGKMTVYTTDADHTLEVTKTSFVSRSFKIAENSITTVVIG